MEVQNDVLHVIKHALDVGRVRGDREVRVQPLVLRGLRNHHEPVLDVLLRLLEIRAPCYAHGRGEKRKRLQKPARARSLCRLPPPSTPSS